MMRRILFALLAAIGLSGTASATSCSFAISALNFGDVDTLAGNAVDVTATLSINCTQILTGTLRVCPNIGPGSGGSSGATRRLSDGAGHTLSYRLYQDSSRSISWGSVEHTALGTPPTFDFVTSINGSVSASRTIYGRVLGGQQAATPGTYTSSFTSADVKISYSELQIFNCLTLASPVTATFVAEAKVQPNCLITAQNIDFGSRGVLRSNTDANGSLSVTCTPGTAYTVGLDAGLYAGTPGRQMANGSARIAYELHRNAARTQPWSTAVGQMAGGTGAGSAQAFTVYGRVPPQPSPAPGTYADTVVATVTY